METKQAKTMAEANNLDIEINQAYIDIAGAEYATAEECEEAYQGKWIDDKEFTQNLIEDTGELPKNMPFYIHIDWEATARDIMMDYSEESGHYFRNL